MQRNRLSGRSPTSSQGPHLRALRAAVPEAGGIGRNRKANSHSARGDQKERQANCRSERNDHKALGAARGPGRVRVRVGAGQRREGLAAAPGCAVPGYGICFSSLLSE